MLLDFGDIEDIALRLTVAAVAGGVLGFNRELRGKTVGVRTLAVAALGSALAVLAVGGAANLDAASRVIQGLVTGIGFLGAGVILRPSRGGDVQGLTTAACIWSTAAIGALCGVGAWAVIITGLALMLLVLGGGAWIKRRWPHLLND
jgi:putative Mg2+ transporter-C (MgtC) family protein